jgi:hypothetical protein
MEGGDNEGQRNKTMPAQGLVHRNAPLSAPACPTWTLPQSPSPGRYRTTRDRDALIALEAGEGGDNEGQVR